MQIIWARRKNTISIWKRRTAVSLIQDEIVAQLAGNGGRAGQQELVEHWQFQEI